MWDQWLLASVLLLKVPDQTRQWWAKKTKDGNHLKNSRPAPFLHQFVIKWRRLLSFLTVAFPSRTEIPQFSAFTTLHSHIQKDIKSSRDTSDPRNFEIIDQRDEGTMSPGQDPANKNTTIKTQRQRQRQWTSKKSSPRDMWPVTQRLWDTDYISYTWEDQF